MSTTNAFDIALVAGLSVVVIAGLISAGMTNALIAGAVIGSTYAATK